MILVRLYVEGTVKYVLVAYACQSRSANQIDAEKTIFHDILLFGWTAISIKNNKYLRHLCWQNFWCFSCLHWWYPLHFSSCL